MNPDEMLQKLGLKFEDLKGDEIDVYNQWLQAVKESTITTEMIKDFIVSMRESVEDELTRHDNGKTHDIFLKARLRNLRLLEAFLSGPERARKALERSMKGVNR